MELKPTPKQKLIIKRLEGHAMVTAEPGCAKTSALALRVRRSLNHCFEPSSIVILTFSKVLSLNIADTLSELVGLIG